MKIRKVDFTNPKDAKDAVFLLNEYARDIMGGGEDLATEVQANLAFKLSQYPGAFSVMAYDGDQPVGLANCFETFSTFNCKPIVNIHDLMVCATHRGQGISKSIIENVKAEAVLRGACKVTLEVLEGNKVARNLYDSVGFRGYELDPKMGKAIFLEMKL